MAPRGLNQTNIAQSKFNKTLVKCILCILAPWGDCGHELCLDTRACLRTKVDLCRNGFMNNLVVGVCMAQATRGLLTAFGRLAVAWRRVSTR